MKTWALRAAAVAVLALVFTAYLRPEFVVDLANRFYMCF
ncbi:hypothetical protein JOD97_006335 [Duganella sp. 1411]|jgi:hypothetical protein|nr:hypothetical protein [Duganella sp. 1411]